jgi:hypothetical protein
MRQQARKQLVHKQAAILEPMARGSALRAACEAVSAK